MDSLWNWQYVPVLVAAVVAGWLLFSTRRELPKRVLKLKDEAREIANHQWYVKGKHPVRGGVELWITQIGDEKRREIISFPHSHPNTSLIYDLVHLSIIVFDFQEEPMVGTNKNDLSSYLKLKVIGRFS